MIPHLATQAAREAVGDTFIRSKADVETCDRCGSKEREHVWFCDCGLVRRVDTGALPVACCGRGAWLHCPGKDLGLVLELEGYTLTLDVPESPDDLGFAIGIDSSITTKHSAWVTLDREQAEALARAILRALEKDPLRAEKLGTCGVETRADKLR